MSDPRRVFIHSLLAVSLVAVSIRLWSYVEAFSHRSLQLDFAAYYTAGEAVRQGLDPYRNHTVERPGLWDGADTFVHSRFLYPPLVATLFDPIARLRYRTAKELWSLANLLALLASLLVTIRLAALRSRELNTAGVVLSLYFYPLLTHLERGQIDILTLLFLVLGVAALARERAPMQYLGGGAFALAALFKADALLLAPFLVIRGRTRALLGLILGGMALVGANVAVHGRAMVERYVTYELPRILAYGESGPPSAKLPPAALEKLRAGLPEGRTRKDGIVYSPAAFSFPVNAALARSRMAQFLPLPRNRRLAALVVFGVLLGLAVVFRAPPRAGPFSPIEELAFWQMAMAAALVASPLTWTMNAVWLIPTIFVALRAFGSLESRAQALWLAITVSGLLVLGLPDVLIPFLFEDRSVVGELVVFCGLLGFSRARPSL